MAATMSFSARGRSGAADACGCCAGAAAERGRLPPLSELLRCGAGAASEGEGLLETLLPPARERIESALGPREAMEGSEGYRRWEGASGGESGGWASLR